MHAKVSNPVSGGGNHWRKSLWVVFIVVVGMAVIYEMANWTPNIPVLVSFLAGYLLGRDSGWKDALKAHLIMHGWRV